MELGRRERKRAAIHQGLLDAADTLFAERGVARTTVDDIAEAADVARQTVFNHFPYKEVFALELAADSISRVAQYAHALLEAGAPATEVLECVAERILDSALTQGERAVVVARELLHPDTERAARAAERVPIRTLLEAVLIQAREEGSIRAELPLDIVANRVCALLAGIVAQIMTTDADLLRKDLSVSLDVIFHGISERST